MNPILNQDKIEAFLETTYKEIEPKEKLVWYHFYQRFLKALKAKNEFGIDFEALTVALAEQSEDCFQNRGKRGCRERERFIYKKICDFFTDYKSVCSKSTG